ncbi:MAG TPA: hypothetical protein VNN10_05795 [Dehalococcoidia bacterium]|nr:hypothetical protein [Dehalococcoidia bacterium]
MQIDFAFLADAAVAEGKLHALGIGIDVIHARQVPATHPSFALVAQVRASVTEQGTKELVVRLIDEDGGDVAPPVQAQFSIGQPAAGMLESTARIIVGFNNVTFQRYGSYSLHLLVQGHEMARLGLRVIPPPG